MLTPANMMDLCHDPHVFVSVNTHQLPNIGEPSCHPVAAMSELGMLLASTTQQHTATMLNPCCAARCCGDAYHMDLSQWAFEKLADISQGVMGIRYRQVQCPSQNTGAMAAAQAGSWGSSAMAAASSSSSGGCGSQTSQWPVGLAKYHPLPQS